MGDTQERLDLIHVGAGAMHAKLEAEGQGPSTVWEPVSSDNDEFEDDPPMTPPMSPSSPPFYINGKTHLHDNNVGVFLKDTNG